jgi:uncharacterized protein (TIGR03067 family)
MRSVTSVLILGLGALSLGCGNKLGSVSSADSGGSNSESDQTRIQGVWAVESFDQGVQVDPGVIESSKKIRYQFQGDTWATTDRKEVLDIGTFSLDVSQNPRGIKVIRDTEPRKQEVLYKFEGENLILALFNDGEPRPTDFKAHSPLPNSPGIGKGAVTIVKLKRTDERPLDASKRSLPVIQWPATRSTGR